MWLKLLVSKNVMIRSIESIFWRFVASNNIHQWSDHNSFKRSFENFISKKTHNIIDPIETLNQIIKNNLTDVNDILEASRKIYRLKEL